MNDITEIKQNGSDCLPTSHVSFALPGVPEHLRPEGACSDKLPFCSGTRTTEEIISLLGLDRKFDDALFEIGRQVSLWFIRNRENNLDYWIEQND